MWLFTDFGFFSIVQKPQDKKKGTLTVRARARQDIESLRDQYLPGINIKETEFSDYRFRARVKRTKLNEAMLNILKDLKYDNFKDQVDFAQGRERHDIYFRVWAAHHSIQERGYWGRRRNENNTFIGGY